MLEKRVVYFTLSRFSLHHSSFKITRTKCQPAEKVTKRSGNTRLKNAEQVE